jgi:hypothetical protein
MHDAHRRETHRRDDFWGRQPAEDSHLRHSLTD